MATREATAWAAELHAKRQAALLEIPAGFHPMWALKGPVADCLMFGVTHRLLETGVRRSFTPLKDGLPGRTRLRHELWISIADWRLLSVRDDKIRCALLMLRALDPDALAECSAIVETAITLMGGQRAFGTADSTYFQRLANSPATCDLLRTVLFDAVRARYSIARARFPKARILRAVARG